MKDYKLKQRNLRASHTLGYLLFLLKQRRFEDSASRIFQKRIMLVANSTSPDIAKFSSAEFLGWERLH